MGSGTGDTDKSSEGFVTVELFGQPYTFKAETKANKAKEIADFLVEEVHKVEDDLSKASASITKNAILIIAALNIANEHFELKKLHSDLMQSLSERSSKLIHALDSAVQ